MKIFIFLFKKFIKIIKMKLVANIKVKRFFKKRIFFLSNDHLFLRIISYKLSLHNFHYSYQKYNYRKISSFLI